MLAQQQISPVLIPSDVAHFGPDQILTAPAISNTTRALAQRDNVIVAKINQLVGFANNSASPVSLTIPRLQISGLQSAIVSNFRIPVGYEARVINASVWTSLATSATLEVVHSAGTYGSTTGTSLCTATDIAEFTAGSDWRGEGELFVRVINTTSSRLELAGSALISLRQVGFQGGDVVGPGGVTTQGPKGDTGDTGPQGPAGTGGGGSGGSVVYIGSYCRIVSYSTSQYRGAKLQVAQDGSSWVDEAAWLEVNQSGIP